jgi:hypothetical protein
MDDDCKLYDLTEEFIETFSEPGEDYRGGFAQCIAAGLIPLGVDRDDPRVREIILRCEAAQDRDRGHPTGEEEP